MKTNPLVARMIGLSIGVLGCLALLAQGVTEEVPRGGLTGTLTMSENGRPLPKAAVYLTEVNGDRYRYVHTDDQGRFVFRNVVAGAYALSFSAKAHTAE
ncbi:MAG: carboxypeptidase-like regulatory domain-containing protein, partial [Nitrospirae bacterium]|nr:carboxypeptidase-like regulatory domain-containing protein [Fimbriimonadaceae bacterium]